MRRAVELAIVAFSAHDAIVLRAVRRELPEKSLPDEDHGMG
jgi:hypothetical protein